MSGSKPRWGVEPDAWAPAVAEIRGILVGLARERRTISYGDLVAGLGSVRLHPRSPALPEMLEEIDRASFSSDGVMLAALVRHAGGDHMRGNRFFRVAEDLGFDTSDRRAFWEAEVERVFERFGGGPACDERRAL